MTLNSIQNWFLVNPKGLRLIKPLPGHPDLSVSVPIQVNGIINHKDTFESYISMIKEGIKPEYYKSLVSKYINEYDSLKIN